MSSPPQPRSSPQPADAAVREDSAHEQRNWVRLNYTCNDRCRFCLDADNHDGSHRSRDEIAAEILAGRRNGASRLILSGGEPTIHPDYLDLVRLGARAGYRRVQTISNGRMFAYPDFLRRAVAAGLGEITFSIHGPDARIHDALVGTRGGFDQAVAGLRHALAIPELLVSVDVVVNRANVGHLAAMIEQFHGWGVREIDLLQIVPFGRAYASSRKLFYDLEAAAPDLAAGFATARRLGVELWCNRFPPEHLEGAEHLIQDPCKLYDEVRGRRAELARWVDHGVVLDCRSPDRCALCFLRRFCDGLERALAEVTSDPPVVILDRRPEPPPAAALSGDPASARRLAASPRPGSVRPTVDPATLAAAATQLIVRAPDVPAALAALEGISLRGKEVELDLKDYGGLAERFHPALTTAARVTAVAGDPEQADLLVAIPELAEVVVLLGPALATWLTRSAAGRETSLEALRLVLRQPTYARLRDAMASAMNVAEFLASFDPALGVEDLPVCVAAHHRPRPHRFDTSILDPNGRLDIFRYARSFLVEELFVKSLRCRRCAAEADCQGLHLNYLRVHGFAAMTPR